MLFHCLFSRAGNADLDVLVYTNTTADGEAAAGGAEAYAANVGRLFSGLTDPERQRAVINIDGEKRVCAGMVLLLRWSTSVCWVCPRRLLLSSTAARCCCHPTRPLPRATSRQ